MGGYEKCWFSTHHALVCTKPALLAQPEHILECEKVKEIMENGEKGWLVSEKSEDLLKATEYIKSFKEKR